MMKAYPEYINTKFPWLGCVPSEWTICKTSWFFKISMGQTILKEDLKEDGEFPVFSATEGDHYFGYVNNPSVLLEKGDLIIPARGNSIGAVKLAKEKSTTTQTTIYCKQLQQNRILPKYMFYYMKGFRQNLFHFTQTAIPQITTTQVGTNPLIIPSKVEQISIVRYLDAETYRIDNLIAEKQNFIKLLQEKRQALISHVVTKGLNSNVEMKDSGVEWIGEIPEHWEVTLLKYQTSKIGSGKTPSGGAEVYQEQGIKFLRSQNVYNDGLRLNDVVYISDEIHYEMRGSKVLANDVLLNITGGSIGRTCLAPIDIGEANVNQHVCIIRSKDESFSELLSLIMASTLVSEQVDYLQTGAGREGLNFVEIGQFKIPLPPKSEWKEIVDHLLLSESKIQCLLEETNKSIELLKEHRTALISAAVTGKIDVREEM